MEKRTLRARRCLLLLLDTGLRFSEALGLRVTDVELAERSALAMGKGGKERRVGLSPRLSVELGSCLRRRQAALQEIGWPESPWVFPNDVGGRLCAKALQKRLKAYGQRAGIQGVRVSPHALRHACALTFVRNGRDPFTLQRVLGHAGPAISRRY